MVIVGFDEDAYLKYLAMKFIFDELEKESPNKAISYLVRNTCGDSELLHKLVETYDVVTFTDGEGDLQKNKIPSIITATGEE